MKERALLKSVDDRSKISPLASRQQGKSLEKHSVATVQVALVAGADDAAATPSINPQFSVPPP